MSILIPFITFSGDPPCRSRSVLRNWSALVFLASGFKARSTKMRCWKSPSSAIEEDWQLAVWDVDQGIHAAASIDCRSRTGNWREDPLSVTPCSARPGTARDDGHPRPAKLPSFPSQCGDHSGPFARQIHLGKQQRNFVVILSPIVQLPTELEKRSSSSNTSCPTAINCTRSPAASAPKMANFRPVTNCEQVSERGCGLDSLRSGGCI